MKQKPLRIAPPGANYQIHVIGHRRAPVRDFYHLILRMSWTATFAVVSAFYLAVNGIFALGYLVTGGLANARMGSLADAFFFSVQTMGTITREAVISPVNGQASLSFRVTNERGNRIVDAQIRAVAIRRETTSEGSTFYRMVDLRLSRDRALSLTRSWTAMHAIDEHSPFWKQTPNLSTNTSWKCRSWWSGWMTPA